ncbi:MAG TPA: hypothetical protein VGA13_06515 [Acidimicrobiales bacterium]
MLAVLGRPWLWATALDTVRVLAPRGWWRRPPHLPVPDRRYLEFRMTTQYGEASASPRPQDVVDYLRWRRAWRRSI